MIGDWVQDDFVQQKRVRVANGVGQRFDDRGTQIHRVYHKLY